MEKKAKVKAMNAKRKDKIKQEAKRRICEWLKNSTFDDMSVCGSFLRFDMSIGLFGGYPFKKPKWMKDKKFNKFVTEEEFYSSDYDEIIDELYELESEKSIYEKRKRRT